MIRNHWTAMVITCLVFSIAQWAQAQGGIVLESTQGVGSRIPIAVPICATVDPALKPLATELARVVADDLAFSGLFSRRALSRWVCRP